jgi:glycogen synthase
MNILMISPFDLVAEQFWGPTIRLHSLAKELNLTGHTVTLAGPPPFAREMPPICDGVALRYFKSPFHRYYYPGAAKLEISRRINRISRLPGVMLSRTRDLVTMIRQLRIEVLYLNRAFLDTAYPAAAAALLCRVPVVFDWDDLEGLHGFSTLHGRPLRYQLLETFNEVAFARCCSTAVVASRHLRDFARQIGVAPERLFYAPSVGDAGKFHPDNDSGDVRERYGLTGHKVLLYCGNLMTSNGVKVEVILHTLQLLLERDPDFRLLVLGDGDLLSVDGHPGALPELAQRLGIADRVSFAGAVPYAEVPRHLAAADLCLALFPVNLITMTKSPLKVYEYLAAGKPVLARDVGEMSHCVLDGVNGRLVYSDDPQEYADKIVSVFADDAHRTEMGRNARRTIEERFLWSNSASEVLKACQGALSHVH